MIRLIVYYPYCIYNYTLPNLACRFIKTPLESGFDKFVTILLHGVVITIPSSVVSLVKTFGLGILLGVNIYNTLIANPIVMFTNENDLNEYLNIDLNALNQYRRELDIIVAQLSSQISEMQWHNLRFQEITTEWDFIIPPDWNVPDPSGLQHTIRMGPGMFDIGLNTTRPFLWELWAIRERWMQLEESIEALYVRGLEIENLIDQMYGDYFHPWGGRISPFVEITNAMRRPFGVYTTRGLALWEGRGIPDS